MFYGKFVVICLADVPLMCLSIPLSPSSLVYTCLFYCVCLRVCVCVCVCVVCLCVCAHTEHAEHH